MAGQTVPSEAFLRHYRRFLGIDEGRFATGETVFACEQRTIPLVFHTVTPLLATLHRGRVVFSVAPAHEAHVRKWFKDHEFESLTDDLLGEMDDCFHELIPLRAIWRMHRLTVTADTLVTPAATDRVEPVTEDHRDVFLASMKPRGRRVRHSNWWRNRHWREEGRHFVIVEDGKLAAVAFVSDIDWGGGNIGVGTQEEYRQKGYGAAVTAAAARWCLENDILPIYWVMTSNEASVRLATSLGFTHQFDELAIRVVR
jgi:RimJ/RimL family protein N-acetyltransferase